jgi:hypothetical protein
MTGTTFVVVCPLFVRMIVCLTWIMCIVILFLLRLMMMLLLLLLLSQLAIAPLQHRSPRWLPDQDDETSGNHVRRERWTSRCTVLPFDGMQNGTLFSQFLSPRKRPRMDRSTHSHLYGTFVLHSKHSPFATSILSFCLFLRFYSFTK